MKNKVSPGRQRTVGNSIMVEQCAIAGGHVRGHAVKCWRLGHGRRAERVRAGEELVEMDSEDDLSKHMHRCCQHNHFN